MRIGTCALVMLVLAFAGCRPKDGPVKVAPASPSNWEGEYRYSGGGTSLIRVCGSGRRYTVAGAGADELVQRYAAAHTTPGSAVKVWLEGTTGTAPVGPGGALDSVLLVTKVLHVNSTLRCAPIPSPNEAGRYEMDLPGSMGTMRHVILDLFTNGSARMYTDLGDGSATLEEDGLWGMNGDDQVQVIWTKSEVDMRFRFADGRLTTDRNEIGTTALILQRTGQPDASAGVFSQVARELASIAQGQGRTIDVTGLLPSTPLKTLFPDESSLQAMRDHFQKEYDIDQRSIERSWKAAETVGDVVNMVRSQERRDG